MAALRLRRAAWQQTNYSGEARILIPDGYITIPEALRRIRDLIDDDDFRVRSGPPIERERLIRGAAIHALGRELIYDFWLEAYLMDGGAVRPIPKEDMKQLIEEGWYLWAESGRVHFPDSWWEDWEVWNPGQTAPQEFASERYDGCTPLIRENIFESIWKPAKKVEGSEVRERPSVPFIKTGAPGRPSSMWLVLQEHKRRLDCGQCESSRTLEAKALEKWFAENVPGHPPVKANSIRNALPKSFQPHNCRPKL